MNDFIIYSLLAALLWGIMGVAESVASQESLYAALIVKYLIYGVIGMSFVLLMRGFESIQKDTEEFINEKPKLFALFCAGIVAGLFGTYFAYRSFESCGENKGLAVIITYCVPVVVALAMSYTLLNEKYNRWSLLGVALILGGVLVIDLLGVDKPALRRTVTTSPTVIVGQ